MTRKLTNDEKRRLVLILEELKERGDEIPNEFKEAFVKKQKKWPVDTNGYFIRRDGHLYTPTNEQREFIDARERFVLYRGGRGCISGDTLIDGVPIAEKMSVSHIKSIYGDFLSSEGYLKGKDSIYRVVTQSGKRVRVTGHHRFLTPSGWLHLNQLSVGDSILVDETLHGEMKKGKSSSFLDDCSLDFRLCGELRDLLVQVSSNILQQPHNTVYDSSALFSPFHLSTVDFLGLLLFQFFLEYSSELISFSQLLTAVQVLCQFLYNQALEGTSYRPYQEQKSYLVDFLPSQSLSPYFVEHSLQTVGLSLDNLRFLNLCDHSYADDKSFPIRDFLGKFGLDSSFSALVYQSSVDNQRQVFYKFYSMYREVNQILYQLGMSFESQELVEQFLSQDTFSSGDIGILYYKILQYYKPRLEKSSASLQYHLHLALKEFLDGLFHNLQFLGGQVLSSLSLLNSHYSNMRFDKIQEIRYDEFGEFYDIEVPYAENYLANGIYHHNSGKSAAGAQKACRKIKDGWSGAVINPVFSDFIDSTWQEFKQWIPWDLVVPSHKHRVHDEWIPNKPFRMSFTNGAFVICKGLKNPESARGPNINFAWYDEGRNDPTGLAWKNLISSVRVGDNPQAWCTTTPVGISHWMYEFFEEGNIGEDVRKLLEDMGLGIDDLTASFHGSIEDNKDNLDPMFYVSILSSYPSGYLREREVYGEYSDAGGKIGDARWFTDKILDEVLPYQEKILRYWDLAATEKKQAKDDPDEMVGSLVSRHRGDKREAPDFMIQDQVCGFWGDEKAIQVIAQVARSDGPMIPVWVEEEPGAAGKITVAAVKEYFKRFPELQAHTVKGLDVKKVGDRVLAANLLWFSVAAEGRMYMKRAKWNKETLKQVDGFTQIAHDDRCTSVTNAMFVLNPYKSFSKMPFVTI